MPRFVALVALFATVFIVSVEACHQGRIAANMRGAANLRRQAARIRAGCRGKAAQASAKRAQARNYRGMYTTLYNRYAKAQKAKSMKTVLQAEYNKLMAAKKAYLSCFNAASAARKSQYNRYGVQQKQRAEEARRKRLAAKAAERQRDIENSKRLRAQEKAARDKKLAQIQEQKQIVDAPPAWLATEFAGNDLDWLNSKEVQQESTQQMDSLKGMWWAKRSSIPQMFVKRDTIALSIRALRSAQAAVRSANAYCGSLNSALAKANADLANWMRKYNTYRKKVGAPDVQKWLALHKQWSDKTNAERKNQWPKKLARCRKYRSNMPKTKTVPIGGDCLFTWDCKIKNSYCSSGGKGIGMCKQKCQYSGAIHNKSGHCMDAPPGHKCFINRQCRSYFCKDGKCAKSMIGIDLLARCLTTSDCMKGAFCYRFKGRGKYGHCQQVCKFTKHQRGARALRVGGFCHNAPGGHPCFIDSQCYTKKCDSKHKCTYEKNAPTGHPCLSHSMCASGICSVHGNGVRRCM